MAYSAGRTSQRVERVSVQVTSATPGTYQLPSERIFSVPLSMDEICENTLSILKCQTHTGRRHVVAVVFSSSYYVCLVLCGGSKLRTWSALPPDLPPHSPHPRPWPHWQVTSRVTWAVTSFPCEPWTAINPALAVAIKALRLPSCLRGEGPVPFSRVIINS